MRMIRAMLDSSAPVEEIMNDTSQVTLRDIRRKLAWSNTDYPNVVLPTEFGYNVQPLITIWFNAWKYENTEQVWAGLADSIIKGIANRMHPVDREWFYMMLNLHRRDVDGIRRWVSDKVWTFLFRKLRALIYSLGFVTASSIIAIAFGYINQMPIFSQG